MEAHSKWSWRRIIKQRIKQKNLNDLIKWSETYKKINTEEVKRRSMEMTPYMKRMNLKESRVIFRKSCSLLHTVRMNWKRKYQDDHLDCVDCLELDPPVRHPDTQDALLSSLCLGNNDLKKGRNH